MNDSVRSPRFLSLFFSFVTKKGETTAIEREIEERKEKKDKERRET
mgnify:CR=1 FL=1